MSSLVDAEASAAPASETAAAAGPTSSSIALGSESRGPAPACLAFMSVTDASQAVEQLVSCLFPDSPRQVSMQLRTEHSQHDVACTASRMQLVYNV